MKIPEQRLNPQLKENPQFMKHLKRFHAATLAAREARFDGWNGNYFLTPRLP